MRRLLWFVLVVALLGLYAPPAFGETRPTAAATSYKSAALQVNDDLLAWGRVVGYTIATASQRRDDELRWQFLLFGQGVRSVRRDLRQLRPPPALRRRHAAVAAALGPVVADLFRISRAARDSSAERARSATSALFRHSESLRRYRRAWVRAVRRL